MPIEQKNLKTPETKNDLIAQKQEMFKKIAETFPEYRELAKHTEANPIAFVFQHSIADGLELAKKLHLTPEEIRKNTIENPKFGLSHYDVIQKVHSKQYMGLPQNVHSENVFNQVHGLKTFDWSYLGPLSSNNNRVYFESVFEKSRDEIKEFPKEIIDSIGDYYAEFLPYQADKLGRSAEEVKNEQVQVKNKREKSPEQLKLKRALDAGEKILFEKYIETLAKEVEATSATEPIDITLANLGIPAEEINFMVEALRQHNEQYPSNEKLPTLVINDGGGAKMNFNMEAARKPVARIKEKIITQEITKSIENIINEKYGSRHYGPFQVIFDETLGQHIISCGLESEFSKEQQNEIIYKQQEAIRQFEALFAKYNLQTDRHTLQGVVDDFRTKNEDFRKEMDAISDVDSLELGKLDLYDALKTLEYAQNPDLKKAFEYYMISDRIDHSFLKGIPEYLGDVATNKQQSALSDQEVGELFLKFQDHVKSDLKRKPDIEIPLAQLDTFKNKTIENFAKYFELKTEQEIAEETYKKGVIMRTMIEQSKWLFDSIKTAMKDKAKWLLESFSLPAKSDGRPGMLADRLIAACYPEEWQKWQDKLKEQNQKSNNTWFEYEDSHGSTQNLFESSMMGANVGAKKNSMESKETIKGFEATFDKPIKGMLVTNVLSYNQNLGTWKRTYVPVDGDMVQNRKFEKVSAILKTPINDTVSVIPAPLGTKEFSTNKSFIEKDSLGLHIATGNEALSKWSYEIPVGNLSIDDVSEQTYTRFLDRLIDEGGINYIEKIPGLPAECQMFLDTIKNLQPRDRVTHIQRFITSHSFYDSYDNEIRNEMNNASVAERLSLMQERLSQLRDELGDQVPDTMLFAGVCADFSVVGEMMLKESGIAAGTVSGYHINGTTINSDNAHAKNIVMWPDETGKTIMAEVEMTPSAITESQRMAFTEQGLQPEPLQEIIQEAEVREKEHEQELKNTSDEILHQIDEILAQSLDATVTINRVELRNHIVDYISSICSLEDLYVYKRMLESYRFTPIKSVNTHDLSEKVKSMGFMQDEYKRWKNDYKGRDDGLERISNSGKNLMGEIDRLYIKSAMAGTKEQFISTFKNISEYLNTELSDKHKTLWKLFTVYVENK